MKYCKFCREELEDQARVCTQCGRIQDGPQSGQRPAETGYGLGAQGGAHMASGYGATPQGGAQPAPGYVATPQGGAQPAPGYGAAPQGGAQSAPGYGASFQGGAKAAPVYGASPQGGAQPAPGYGAANPGAYRTQPTPPQPRYPRTGPYVPPGTAGGQVPQSKPSVSHFSILVVILLVVIVFLAGAFVWLFMQHQKQVDGAKMAPAGQQQTQQTAPSQNQTQQPAAKGGNAAGGQNQQNNGTKGGQAQQANAGVITGTDVRMRAGAGTNYDIADYFEKGEQVTILESRNRWYKVQRANGSIGWVSQDFCKRN